MTPLMFAAAHAADETIAFLLSIGASPDLVDNANNTALLEAIHSSCSSTIALLAPVTRKGLEQAIEVLAQEQTARLTPAGEDLVKR